MAEALTTQEETAVEEFLAELRSREQAQNVVLVSEITAVKFLMARKFDVPRAIDLFQAYKNTRIKEGIYNINPEEEPLRTELLSGKFTVLPGRDAKGAALALFTARFHRPDLTSHKAVLQAIIYQLDKAIESIQTQRDGLVFIYDMTSSTYANFDYELCVKILNLLKGAFPARLKCVFIVSSPLWFRAPFAVLRLFVREKLRERVCTVKANELASHIPVSSLPDHLGGTLHHSHMTWVQSCVNSSTTGQHNDANDNMNCVGDLPPSYWPGQSVVPLDGTNANLPNHQSPASHTQHWNGSALQGRVHHPPPQSDTPPDTPLHNTHTNTNTHSSVVMQSGCGIQGDGVTEERNREDYEDDVDGVPPLPQKSRPPPPSHSPPLLPASVITELSVHMPEPGGMTVHELVDHVKRSRKRGIYQEYEQIRKEPPTGTFNYSKKPSNQNKNRYSDVLCLDESRVRLTPLSETEDETSDYINASFMDGYKRIRTYVATQGPLPKTFGDFWRMVWEQMVLIIVMTTRVVERGRIKCGQYWPLDADHTEDYGSFLVKNVQIKVFQDFKLTHLELYNKQTGERRDVSHYLYMSWPDFGVPKSASAMLDFRAQVKERQEAGLRALGSEWTGSPGGPPIVVHCSAGIGRTGTFCTLDICLSRLEDIGTVDIKETVRRMRTQRAFSIQTWDQYYFCYTSIIEYAQRTGRIPPLEWSDAEIETDSE